MEGERDYGGALPDKYRWDPYLVVGVISALSFRRSDLDPNKFDIHFFSKLDFLFDLVIWIWVRRDKIHLELPKFADTVGVWISN